LRRTVGAGAPRGEGEEDGDAFEEEFNEVWSRFDYASECQRRKGKKAAKEKDEPRSLLKTTRPA
jgi:hypothetical protein